MTNNHLNILISPLDWGLGHASRCIPIIRFLLKQGHKVVVAASGLSLELLQKNFEKDVTFVRLPGYDISYAKNAESFTFKVLKQLPHIIRTIKSEHEIVQQLVQQFKIDGIISDNRYGVYHPDVPSYFMTHQYQILSGINVVADAFLLKMHEARMKRFDDIWLVDEEKETKGLAGRLSHPKKIGVKHVSYIGHLSQLENTNNESKDLKQVLLLLSGPEPARTQLYELFLKQAGLLKQYNFVIITGSNLPLQNVEIPHIQQYGLSSQTFIQQQLQKADLVVCRSGYSTIMDLIAVQQKALLIPTPGQAEQVYIAQELQHKGMMMQTSQATLSLEQQLPTAYLLKGFTEGIYSVNETYKGTIDQMLTTIMTEKSKKNSDH